MALILVQLLELCPGGFVNAPNKYGWAPLHILANGKDKHGVVGGMVRNLIRARADVAIKRARGMTPLHVAASTGNESVASALMALGADPSQPNDEGTTALDLAWNNRSVYNVLSDAGSAEGVGATGTGRLLLLCVVQRSAISQLT